MRRLISYLALTGLAVFGLLIAAGVYKTSGEHAYAEVSDEQAAMARAYLANAQPPVPEGAVFGRFERVNGIPLETLTLPHPAPKATIVIAPGFTAPLEVYASTFAAFHDAGYAVTALSQRGQGRSWRALPNPEKGYVEDYHDLSADLAAYINALDGQVMVYGNSMGAHIATLMAGTEDVDVAAYVLLVPMAKIQTGEFPYGVAKALTGFYSALGFGANYGFGRGDWRFDQRDIAADTACSADPARAHTRHMMVALDPALRVEGVTNQWVWETMQSTAQAAVPDHLARITAPVMTITAGADTVVDSAAAEANCSAMPNCQLKRIEAARHCIMHEGADQRDGVHAASIAFFNGVKEE